MIGVDVFEGLVDGLRLFERVGMGDIDHVQQQVGFGDFFEGGAEGRYQLGGQFLDETDRVGKERPVPARKLHPAGGGVQGGKELVGDVHVGVGQAVEQG